MDKSTSGEFSQNTLSYNGVAHGLRFTGRHSNITLNHMEGDQIINKKNQKIQKII